MNLDRVIAVRNNKTVYQDGDTCIKVFTGRVAAADVLRDMGYNPAVGMNADFFSFQTGVPMSNTVINGRIFTADSSWMPGIGFRSDGTAFCATFPIHTTITLPNGSGFDVECINKYRQPYAL